MPVSSSVKKQSMLNLLKQQPVVIPTASPVVSSMTNALTSYHVSIQAAKELRDMKKRK